MVYALLAVAALTVLTVAVVACLWLLQIVLDAHESEPSG